MSNLRIPSGQRVKLIAKVLTESLFQHPYEKTNLYGLFTGSKKITPALFKSADRIQSIPIFGKRPSKTRSVGQVYLGEDMVFLGFKYIIHRK